MSRPIADTPVLRGEDAVRFMLEMEREEHPTAAMKRARKRESEKIRKLMEKFYDRIKDAL